MMNDEFPMLFLVVGLAVVAVIALLAF